MSDPDPPDLLNQLESLGDFAGTISTYYHALIAREVPPEHAVLLAIGYQNTAIASVVAIFVQQQQQQP